jgi:hypothetical protein
VCKSWRSMVAEPHFVRLQLHHSTTAARRRPPSMLVLSGWRILQERMGTICFFRYPGHGALADLAYGHGGRCNAPSCYRTPLTPSSSLPTITKEAYFSTWITP